VLVVALASGEVDANVAKRGLGVDRVLTSGQDSAALGPREPYEAMVRPRIEKSLNAQSVPSFPRITALSRKGHVFTQKGLMYGINVMTA
jgi:hypothetical protein